MAYETNRFCWFGVNSTDTAKAKEFYPAVTGVTVMSMAMDDSAGDMLMAGDIPFAHLTAPPVEGAPSSWDNYLRVDDVDATSTLVEREGGEIIVPATDIAPGRFATVTLPSGAHLSVFHEANEETSEHHPGGPGSVHWTELHSHELEADLSFLKAVFGFETAQMPMPDGSTYYVLKHGDKGRAGAMQAMVPEAPSAWLSWVQVTDVDAALATALSMGGRALGEIMDVEKVGRMIMIADNTGGVFGLLTPPAGD